MLLKQLGQHDASQQAFQKIFKVESEIELDHYVAPFAHFEYVRFYSDYCEEYFFDCSL